MSRQARIRLAPAIVLVLGACEAELPDPASDRYREVVAAFYSGLAAMEVGADEHAEAELLRVTRLVPREPAGWANLGVLALRRNEFDAAAERFKKAEALAPQSSSIQLLLGLLEANRGRAEQALAHLRRAVHLDSTNIQAMYALAQEIERYRGRAGEADVEDWLDRILTVDRDNLAILVEMARLAARRGDLEKLQQMVTHLSGLASAWPIEARDQLAALHAAASSRADVRRLATQVTLLRNVLLTVAAYREDLAAVQSPLAPVGEPVGRFLRLPAPKATRPPPDDSLTFGAKPLLPADTPAWAWTGATFLEGGDEAAVFVASGRQLQKIGGPALPFPGGPSSEPPAPFGVAWVDIDNDFRVDIALVGAGGFRLFRQDTAGAFTDVTARTALRAPVIRAPYTGVWAADLDLEGDLDLVLGARNGPPRALRNNGDGTFAVVSVFGEVEGLRGFAWADLDGDGDPDAALLDAVGALHVFVNERGGRFLASPLPEGLGEVLAITAADPDSDGLIDLVLLQADGAIRRLSSGPEQGQWILRELVSWAGSPGERLPRPNRLFVADLDNNGGLDLVAAGPEQARIWLRDAQNGYRPLLAPVDARIFAVSDLNQDGRLDLVGLTGVGQPVAMINRGTKGYRWTRARPRAAPAVGDQRINSFGIGGEIELRSGLLYVKQTIAEPIVHFGLGDNVVGHVARIIWPNGAVQAEFDLQAHQTVQAVQRLKGSCPWVFAYDGQGMRFVTDFPWRSALGMRINAQETGDIMMTEEWIKIPGNRLVPRNGSYEVRITAELWETHFFDHFSLLAVDHPDGTEIFVDERFAVPPPPLAVHVTGRLRPVAGAWDDRGEDVSEVIRARDERYLDTFGGGTHQGVTGDHTVEVDLGDEVPDAGPLWLVASGWIRPTDSSINVALSQGRHPRPRGLRLEVPDGRNGWVVVREDLGFPAGKSKTVLISLEDVFQRGVPHRLRLRTNLEIYWDRIAWAVGLPEAETRMRRIAPETADLRYRGFSEVREADRSSPEVPVYERLAGTAPHWRDLIGYYTRFGNVRELLEEVDDRYVIMNAGDELALRFAAAPPPPEAWERDFVLINDGWMKDGDYNTAFSKTVLPLPAHDRPDYTTPPGRLQDDPVYQRNSRDWEEVHTRYVTPERFRRALVADPIGP
ncbi:MAG: VCBS repeat-containing protein [Gemmatimonadetes bacterium]|nr:VCBS repeat-containing protein [Gemmatimonadota bacterium]